MALVGGIGGFEARIGLWGGEGIVTGDVAVTWRRARYPPHFPRMALAMMQNKSFDPIHVCLLGTTAVLEANFAAHLIQ